MGNFARKIKRQQLKNEFGNNRIQEFWHEQNLTLAQRLHEGMKKASEKIQKR